MQLKSIFLIILSYNLFTWKKCPAITNNCGDVSLNPNSNPIIDTSFYSEPNFKGENKNVTIKGIYGCTNDVPNFSIKSLLSTSTTQITFHYSKDCIGHVIDQIQGGSIDLDSKKGCPGSVFVKLNRYGSC